MGFIIIYNAHYPISWNFSPSGFRFSLLFHGCFFQGWISGENWLANFRTIELIFCYKRL
jgi:hypothetical protein